MIEANNWEIKNDIAYWKTTGKQVTAGDKIKIPDASSKDKEKNATPSELQTKIEELSKYLNDPEKNIALFDEIYQFIQKTDETLINISPLYRIFSNLVKVFIKNMNTKLDAMMLKKELSVKEIAQARKLIEAIENETKKGDYYEKLQYKVPYFNQLDSEHGDYRAERMCNMSSMAMGLALFGVEVDSQLKQDKTSKDARAKVFKGDMQEDDIVEQVRLEQNIANPYGLGQRNVAKKYGYYFGGLEGKDDKTWTEHTGLWGNKDTFDYNWYEKNILPELRKGYSITLGVKSRAKYEEGKGHIVHLLGVTKVGLYIHDPYSKTNLLGINYNEMMRTDKNSKSGEGTTKGKNNFWKFEDIKNAKAFYISTFKVLKK